MNTKLRSVPPIDVARFHEDPLPPTIQPVMDILRALTRGPRTDPELAGLNSVLTAALRSLRRPSWERAEGPPCPLTVAGRECTRSGGKTCLCQDRRSILDHVVLWHLPEGGYVLTAEPYELDLREVVEFKEALAAVGLRVTVSPDSSYYPGLTFLITISKQQNPDPHGEEEDL